MARAKKTETPKVDIGAEIFVELGGETVGFPEGRGTFLFSPGQDGSWQFLTSSS